MNSTFSTYFSSKSKSQILEILYHHSQPIHLRLIHKLSDLSIHTIDLALKELLELKIIRQSKVKEKNGFSLNLKHQDFDLVNAVLKTLKEFQIKKRSKSYSDKAIFTLNFIDDALTLIRSAKANKNNDSKRTP